LLRLTTVDTAAWTPAHVGRLGRLPKKLAFAGVSHGTRRDSVTLLIPIASIGTTIVRVRAPIKASLTKTDEPLPDNMDAFTEWG